jgi:transglutaminase-like putative cysteine protease
MTAAQTPFDLGASYLASREEARRFSLFPAEGWSSVLLLALLCALVGWAIDDAHWVLGDQRLTDFLPWAGAVGVAWGFAAAKLGRGRLVAHGIGALLATLFLVVAIGSQLAPGADLLGCFRVTAESILTAYDDLVVKGRATTSEIGHFLLVLGVLVWATGQFAGYTAYAHRRPLSAVVLPGTILIANVAITVRDQFPILVLFALAALLFLVRLHVADEQRTWARHRIADVGNAVGLSLRSGLTFVGLALLASLVLTSVASSAPLAGAWQGLDQRLIDAGSELARLFPAGGPGTRLGGASFGAAVTVEGVWTSDDTAVLSIATEPGSPQLKWRAATYDRLVGNRWTRIDTVDVPVAAGQPLLAGTSDAPPAGVATRDVSFVVRGVSGSPGILVAPGTPLTVDRPSRVTLVQRNGETWFGGTRVDGGAIYSATASIPVTDETVADALTANRLRAAGMDYPPDLLAVYTDLEPGTAGQDVRALLSTILEAARPGNPYDTARAIESYLSTSGFFHYDTDVRDVNCGGRGIADCFAVSRRGYCEHFATTMVVMLRIQGIPSRLVEGYLPAVRDSAGVETIRRSQAHAWVEAWFPGFGWIDFDPTGGGVGQPQLLPAGPPVPTATPAASGAAGGTPRPSRRNGVDEPAGPTGGGSSSFRTPGIGPIIVVLIPALALLLVLAAAWLRRRLGRPVQPQVVYRTVAGMAGRLGYPRRPTQTVYEYLGALSDAVPSARPELQLVARSTVETTYGRRRLPPERLAALGAAQRRLRVALLRLALRRDRRRKG